MMKALRSTQSMHSRKILVIGLAVAVAALAVPAFAQVKPEPVKLSAHALKGGAYWVEGGTSNQGFIVGNKGVVVIDAQRSVELAQQALAEIAKVTSKPVDTVIVTHGDPDHVAGLPAYPAGTTIIAHENTKSQIVIAAADPKAGPIWGPVYRKLLNFLPTRTIASTETVVLDGVRMVLMYVAPAHSGGDLIVYLPAAKVVYGGDIILTNKGRFPIIHYDTGGSSLGWIAAMKAMLALDADTYVPGHGPIETRAKLQARLRDVEERREQIKAMVNANKSLAEVHLALPEGPFEVRFPSFAETTYLELTKGYPRAAPPWVNIVSDMADIPAGPFTMGANEGPEDERPAHQVTLTAYSIDRFPVTNSQYAEFLNLQVAKAGEPARLYDIDDPDARIHRRAERWRADDGYENHPVVEVPWAGARAYCDARAKRLPTEAEWEKAARATDARRYPWGAELPERRRAQFAAGRNETASIDSFPAGASPYGVWDMAGNAWEWVSSAYRPYPYRADDGREDPTPGPVRGTRGGGHDSPAGEITTTQRGSNVSRIPSAGHHNIGFRCAKSP